MSLQSLLDNEQVQKITEKARLHNLESQEKVFSFLIILKSVPFAFSFYEVFFYSEIALFIQDQEVAKLRKQLNEFVEERRGWGLLL